MCRRSLAFLLLLLLAHSSLHAQPQGLYNTGTSPRYLGGLIVWRDGDQKIVSLGGAVTPRHVTITTQTPDGPVVTKMQTPSPFHSPNNPPIPSSNALVAVVNVTLPEP